ncbi:hypothetical protein D3C78_936670 [compost metagenome]
MLRKSDPGNLHSLWQFGRAHCDASTSAGLKRGRGLLVVARACAMMDVVLGGASFSNCFMA